MRALRARGSPLGLAEAYQKPAKRSKERRDLRYKTQMRAGGTADGSRSRCVLRTQSLGLVAALALATGACSGPSFQPLRLLESATSDGRPARSGRISSGGVTRPALLESASYRVRLPQRALLTFGLGLARAADGPLEGTFRFTLKANGRTLLRRALSARRAPGFADVSLPLDGLDRQATLEFELRAGDEAARRLAAAGQALFGVSEPTVHDLDAYGRTRGVLLVSIDTLRRDHVGVYGYAWPTTPRLDALARAGVLCEDAVSTSSWTLPAHLSMLTSVDPARHGGVDVDHGFSRGVPSVASLLRQSGHATRAVTSHLYVSAAYGVDEGFEQLDFRYDRKADDVAERAMRVLDQVGDRPFFLFLHFYDPHVHYNPPPELRRLFPSPYRGPLAGIWNHFKKLTRETIPPGYLEHLLSLYDGEIRFVDDQLGRVLDHLRARGLERSTLLVVTSDHGEEFLEHGSWAHEKTLYEEVVRIPLIVSGPGVAARREAAQASLLDVAPTILDWAGLPVPPGAQGRSLLAPLAERESYGETLHTKDDSHKLFLRGGAARFKLILSLDRENAAPRREEWYDLAADPAERRGAPPAGRAADALRQRALTRWHEGRRPGGAGPEVLLTPEQVERLRALGYLGT